MRVGREGYRPRGKPHALILADNKPVLLDMTEAGAERIGLAVGMMYSIVEDPRPDFGPWRVSTATYSFELVRGTKRLFAFHWHPASTHKWAHVHLAKDPDSVAPDLALLHVPTSRICIEQVVRLALDLGVRPRRPLAECARILDEGQTAHERYRSWSGAGPRPAS